MPNPPDRQSGLHNLTDQQQKTASPVVPSFPSSLPSSSDSNPDSNSSSSNSESSDRGRSRQKKHKSKYKGIKVNPTSPSALTRASENGEIGNERWNEFSKATHAPMEKAVRKSLRLWILWTSHWLPCGILPETGRRSGRSTR
jgi:hypothetical protein